MGRISFDSTVTCTVLYNNEIWDELNVLHKNTSIYTGICQLLSEPLIYIYVFVYKLSYIMTTYINTRTYTHCISQTISAGEETSNSYKGNICLN